MHRLTHLSSRVPMRAVVVGVLALLAHDTAHAQASPRSTEHAAPQPPIVDSAVPVLRLATPAAPHAPRRGILGRAIGAATGAADVVRKKADLADVGSVAQTALVVAGKANPGVLMVQEALKMQQRDQARAAAALADRQAHSTAAMAGLAAMQTGTSGATTGGLPDDPAFAELRGEYARLVARATGGDRTAAEQLLRFQREMSVAAPTLAAVPAAQQSAAYAAVLRDALRCATDGNGCRAK